MAEAAGDIEAAKVYHQKSVALKEDAKAHWIHGISVRPTASDIHSNLGYVYSEANDLDKAESHLRTAVELQPNSSRPHNNLGRVFLRRSQECEAKAREAEAQGKTDPDEAEKAEQLKEKAKTKRDEAIREFKEAGRLDPLLLEARLNLGEVYLSMNDLDKAEAQYRAIVKLRLKDIRDSDATSNFSVARVGLARIAIARKKSDEAIEFLQQALKLNPQNVAALQLLAAQRFQQGEYREGEKSLWSLLAAVPKTQRRTLAEQFGKQFETDGKHKEAVEAWNFMAWAFATSPVPNVVDPEAAMKLAKRLVEMTKQQDPAALDTLAAAQAASGKYTDAVKTAQSAIRLAQSQGKQPLADAIAKRLQFYQQGKPYRCNPDGSDRP
jgi:tetratricopeptide (TPR) repeat protein